MGNKKTVWQIFEFPIASWENRIFYFQWRTLLNLLWGSYREPKINTWCVILWIFKNCFITVNKFQFSKQPYYIQIFFTFTFLKNNLLKIWKPLFTEYLLQVWNVFRDVCRFWRVHSKNPTKLRRSTSEKEQVSPDTVRLLCSAAVSPSSLIPCSCKPTSTLGRYNFG